MEPRQKKLNKSKMAELSMQVVVLAVIALLVMVILIFIFKSQTGDVKEGFDDIINDTKKGGKLVTDGLGDIFGKDGNEETDVKSDST